VVCVPCDPAISDAVLKRFIDSPSLRHIMCMTEVNAEFLGAVCGTRACGGRGAVDAAQPQESSRPPPTVSTHSDAVLEARAFLTSFMPKLYKGPSPFYSLFSPLSGDGLEKEVETVATQVRPGPLRCLAACPPSSPPEALTALARLRRHAVCAWQLTTLCISLGEFPIIRFDDKGIPARTSGTITSMLAKSVQDKLDAAYEDDPGAFVRFRPTPHSVAPAPVHAHIHAHVHAHVRAHIHAHVHTHIRAHAHASNCAVAPAHGARSRTDDAGRGPDHLAHSGPLGRPEHAVPARVHVPGDGPGRRAARGLDQIHVRLDGPSACIAVPPS